MVRRRAGLRYLWVALLIAIVAPLALQSCGGDEPSEEDRTLEMCDACDGRVEGDCLRECLRFCLPDEDCETRCEAQCDTCRRDLRCQACSGGCDGAEPARCAPLGEVITCEDGSFGGGGVNVPTNTPTATITPTTATVTPTTATITPTPATTPTAPTPTTTP